MATKTVVIDVGTDRVEVGFAGDDKPSIIFPCRVGRSVDGEVFVGDEIEGKLGLQISKPVSHGIIGNFDDMTLLYKHAFEKLGVPPSSCNVILTEAPLNPKANRERMVKVIFDDVGVPSVYIAIAAVLALYQSQRTTGIVLDIGEAVSHTVPIYEGYALPHAIIRLDLAESDMDEYFIKIMGERGVDLTSAEDRREVPKIRKECCYVALDFEQEMATAASGTSLNKTYTMPDGRSIEIGNERFRCPETYFQPAFVDMESAGIHETTYNSIMKCDVDIRKDLYRSTVLAGLGSTYPGMEQRMKREISALAPPTMQITVLVPEGSDTSVWSGGSTLAMLSTFQQMWISKMEYKAFGATIVHRKCF